jgi:hypothetical protein
MHVLGRIRVPVVRAESADAGRTLQASAGEAVMSDDRPDTLRGAIKDGMEVDGHYVRACYELGLDPDEVLRGPISPLARLELELRRRGGVH